MKALWKVLGVILACLVLLLVVARIVGFEPNGRRPGLWLKGDLVTTPVTDWSFTEKVQNVKLQTNTWYLVPHMRRGSPTLMAGAGTRTWPEIPMCESK